MDPITIAAVAGAGMQWMNSEQARQASAAERKRMADIVNAIQLPTFDPSSLTPQDYKMAQKYVPEMAQFIEEKAPETIKETGDMVAGRQSQRDALQRLSEISSNSGIDPQLAAMSNEAARKSQTEAQVRQQSILQDAARRGQLGSGAALAQQLAGASEGMDRQAQVQNQLAMEAYRDRLNALSQGATLGGQIRDQDIGLQGKNVGIINAFNQRNTANQQNYLNQNADTRNTAQRLNIGNQQDVMNKNTGAANEFAKYNQNRGDNIANSLFKAQSDKAGLLTGQGTGRISDIRQNAADQNQSIQGIGNIFQSYSANNASEEADKNAQNREDRRTQYMKTGSWTPMGGTQ